DGGAEPARGEGRHLGGHREVAGAVPEDRPRHADHPDDLEEAAAAAPGDAVAPRQSYILWFSQRVGSTLLAQALEDTGIAGRPREWFNAADATAVLAKHGVATARALREFLWREAVTPNGVLGIKYGMRQALHDDLTALFEAGGLSWSA